MRFARQLFVLFHLIVFIADGQSEVRLEKAFANLSFDRPVDLQHAGDGTDRLFVVEQRGVIYMVDTNLRTKSVFLDIQDRVNDAANEEGLLGLAFHPDFEQNGYFFVDYTAANPRRTIIARYSVRSDNSNAADISSERIILQQPQPYSNHNAGQIAFGPDGYLYITFGDGGSGGDPLGHGQNKSTLLGTICRIDVNATQGDLNYAIPPDNPFVGNQDNAREEIYAYGLRNPWRMSFDSETGWLWAADVGQQTFEEIDIIEKGKNYGWKIMEGTSCYNTSTCDTSGLTLPIWQYGRSAGTSVTGGYVYRGQNVPELYGAYVYADFVSGRIWALRYDGSSDAANELLLNTDLFISSFGIDRHNELYICAFDGFIYTFRSTTKVTITKDAPDSYRLGQNYPNPFNAGTRIPFSLPRAGHVTLRIYNLRGEMVQTLVDHHVEAGDHVVDFQPSGDAKELTSGVYIYNIETDEFKTSKRFLLMR